MRTRAQAARQRASDSASSASGVHRVRAEFVGEPQGGFVPDMPGAYVLLWKPDGTVLCVSAPEGSQHRKPERPGEWLARRVGLADAG